MRTELGRVAVGGERATMIIMTYIITYNNNNKNFIVNVSWHLDSS